MMPHTQVGGDGADHPLPALAPQPFSWVEASTLADLLELERLGLLELRRGRWLLTPRGDRGTRRRHLSAPADCAPYPSPGCGALRVWVLKVTSQDPIHNGEAWHAAVRRLSPAVLGRPLDVRRGWRSSGGQRCTSTFMT